MNHKKLTIKALTVLGALLMLSASPIAVNNVYAGVNIQDNNLANALVSITGVSSKSQLTSSVLAGLTGNVDLSDKDITILVGIEYLTNVTSIDLSLNPIYERSEIARLADLTNLKDLNIAGLSVSVLPKEICTMTWLDTLDISANRFTSLPSEISSLSLDVLKCNYCYLDVSEGTSEKNNILAAATSPEYLYQLTTLANMTATCTTVGTMVISWDAMPDITYPNTVVAKIQRYSICEPSKNLYRGDWIDYTDPAATSYAFEGLTSTIEYSFDISTDYYITGSPYDKKYIKNYQKIVAQPYPQIAPTAVPTPITPTPTVLVTTAFVTPSPSTADVVKPVSTITTAVTLPPSETSSKANPLNIIIIVICVLIGLILILTIILIIRAKSEKKESRHNRR